MKIGIIAALPREVSGLVKGWKRRQLGERVVVYSNGDVVVAYAGMGAARATLAVQAAMACDPKLRVGEIIRAGVVVDARTGERFENSQYRQVLVSTDAIASVKEKARLHASYSAVAVDMEAASVARLAQAHGLGFHAIKAISDEADFELAGLAHFSTAEGQFREVAFALHAVLRPVLWSKAIALGRNSSKAVSTLTEALRVELDWYRK